MLVVLLFRDYNLSDLADRSRIAQFAFLCLVWGYEADDVTFTCPVQKHQQNIKYAA